jgi:hypothetical protein
MSLDLDLRLEEPRDTGNGGSMSTIRERLGFGRATVLGIGYLGGLDLRGGGYSSGIPLSSGRLSAGCFIGLDAYPLGIALRAAGGAMLAVTGGVGADVCILEGIPGLQESFGDRTYLYGRVPIEVSAELPLGPVRVTARAELAWRLGGDAYAADARGLADEASAFLGVRLGKDRRYWADTRSGSGLYVGFVYRDVGGAEFLGFAVGVNVRGGN